MHDRAGPAPAPAVGRSSTRARGLVEALPLFAREWLLVVVAGAGYLESLVVALVVALRGALVPPEGDLRKVVLAYAALATFTLTVAALLPLAHMGPRLRRFVRGTLVVCVLYSYVFEVTQHARGLDPRLSEFWTLSDNALSYVYLLTSQGYVLIGLLLALAFFRRSTEGPEGPLVVAVRYALVTTGMAFGAGYLMLSGGRGHVSGDGSWLVLHAYGSHGLQAVPLLAWLLGRTPSLASLHRALVHVGGWAWLLGGVAIVCQTASGRSMGQPALASALFVTLMATFMGLVALPLGWSSIGRRPGARRAASTLLPGILCVQALAVVTCLGLTTWSPQRAEGLPPTASPNAEPPAPRPPLGTIEVHGLEFVHLPAGSFTMGCATGDTECDADELPRREVQVESFYLARTETPVRAWRQCESEGACSPRSSPDPRCSIIDQSDQAPVVCVDYADAAAFCGWMGGRLPTAAEWEYAAKSGRDVIYPWGNEPASEERARFGWAAGVAPVDHYAAGASPWGLSNMAGNVLEWTSTDYSPRFKEHRGGAWSQRARGLRASNRSGRPADSDAVSVGIRCAR